MKHIKNIFIIILAVSILNLCLPKMTLAQQQVAKAETPKHQPQSWGTPEEDIPTIKEKKKRSGWIWLIVLGLLGIGGGAAALSGDGGDEEEGDTGSYTGTW